MKGNRCEAMEGQWKEHGRSEVAWERKKDLTIWNNSRKKHIDSLRENSNQGCEWKVIIVLD